MKPKNTKARELLPKFSIQDQEFGFAAKLKGGISLAGQSVISAAHDSPRLALLIDSDNVSAVNLEGVLAELATYGTVAVRRMYGDWTSEHLRPWKSAANEHSVQPVQQFSYTTGKNATDSALIIDAMDLLHQNHLDGFAIVSSDSDFTRLAARIRESGAYVVGFGERKTPKPFVNACNNFVFLDVLVSGDADQQPGNREVANEGGVPVETVAPTQVVSRKQLRQDTRLMNLLRAGIAAGTDEEGWSPLSVVGSTVQKQAPEFDSRNWGYQKLSDLVQATGLFELNWYTAPSGNKNCRVKLQKKK